MRTRGASLIKIILAVSVIMILLTLNTVAAYDKETDFDKDSGWSGEYAKVRVGGTTVDKKYYSDCWIHFVTKGTWFISVTQTKAWLYGYQDPEKTRYEIDSWSFGKGAVDEVRSRSPPLLKSQTYAIKGVCEGYFKNKILKTTWTRQAERTLEAADPPFVPAIVFFNVTS
ncbi:MAG: hypothetical protein ACTSXW_05545 [Candidatus Baldrarchaeia archaeon]